MAVVSIVRRGVVRMVAVRLDRRRHFRSSLRGRGQKQSQSRHKQHADTAEERIVQAAGQTVGYLLLSSVLALPFLFLQNSRAGKTSTMN